MAAYSALADPSAFLRTADGVIVHLDPSGKNADWNACAAWLAAGNTPDPLPPVGPPTQIQADVFLARFTPTEQIAVQAASLVNPQIAFGLTLGLAQGFVILTSPILANWMAGLVAAGAITPARSAAIMTP